MAYVAAHCLTLLLNEGQAIGYLASDPLGRGWNLFGTAASGIDYSLLDAAMVWFSPTTGRCNWRTGRAPPSARSTRCSR